MADGWLPQVHGILMILAWMGAAGVGKIIARYYKQTWKHIKPLDKDLWFRLHQGLMGLAILLTVIGFICILAEEGWELEAETHQILGMVCIISAFIQPIMAVLRPAPDSPKRWIFNLAHGINGGISFGFALAAIFNAVPLDDTNLPQYSYYIMIAYLVLYLGTHLALSWEQCQRNKRDSDEVYPETHGLAADGDAPGSGFRKIVLAVFALGSVILSIVIIILIIDYKP